MDKVTVGIIGGTALYEIEGLKKTGEEEFSTPFGKPSDKYIIGILEDTKVAFLPRHGIGHRILPSEINFRANIYGMKKLGAEFIISVGAVGSLKEEIKPRDFVFPDQFYDRTKARPSTFFGDGIVAHINFADPICQNLREIAYKKAKEIGISAHNGGTYICMEGPQFSTRAESHSYRKLGFDIIGMTNLQEAKLAREAEICYVTIALVTDYDCWKTDDEVNIDLVIENLKRNSENAKKLIMEVVKSLPKKRDCKCISSLKDTIITSQDKIPKKTLENLSLLISKYI
jgi:5'-methylthioadenosine phosphorylase